ncbi:class I SAM-dependent methyltransferase [Yoonia sp. I 8.24]|uniref:class I SAM-dependent DNA methyltransferase n=1 Tax=Yoonia sp. I 8.24 TaxID=1537229 RepID=UPI001EDFD6FF|nr:class I SAM-dependent methyltransferase [Yoonia sp. I 8.24]MCG3269253.1 class I SAM-dependent methyltransferase [Yoonia sp. I 8.24]
MPDQDTIATYNAKAADYAKFNKTDHPDADLQAFIDIMPKGAHVLDLGCGPASASAHMRDAGLLPDPVDAAQGMVDLANQTHAINARLARFDDITAIATYDGVWANFSLLHAPRAALPGHLQDICNALKPGGIFHIGMKTGTGKARDAIARLYTYVEVVELKDLLHAAGLTVVFTREGVGKGLAGTNDPFVIMRAKKVTDA